MYTRYIKPSRIVSKAAMIQKMEQLTKQSDTEMLLDHNSKIYRFKFTVEQFATRRQAFDMFNKAKSMVDWQKYFVEVEA